MEMYFYFFSKRLDLLPQLPTTYPDTEMTMNVFCTKPPSLTYAANGASVAFTGQIQMLVNVSDHLLTAFTIDGWAGMSLDVKLSGTTLYGDFNYIEGNFTVSRNFNVDLKSLETTIGDFSASILTDLYNLLFNKGLVPLMNDVLGVGLPLPVVPGLTFVNPQILFGDGYMEVSTSATYTPTV